MGLGGNALWDTWHSFPAPLEDRAVRAKGLNFNPVSPLPPGRPWTHRGCLIRWAPITVWKGGETGAKRNYLRGQGREKNGGWGVEGVERRENTQENHADVLQPMKSSCTCSDSPTPFPDNLDMCCFTKSPSLCIRGLGSRPWSHSDYRALFWTKNQNISGSRACLCRWCKGHSFLALTSMFSEVPIANRPRDFCYSRPKVYMDPEWSLML